MSEIEDDALQYGAHELVPEPRLRLAETVDETADVFARLAVELHSAGGVEETIDAVVQFALQALSCSYSGVALYTRGRRPEIPAVTDPVVAEIYNLQIDNGAGPLIESLQHQSVVLVRDTTVDARWPTWAAAVARLGVRSVLDVPLAVGAASSRSFGVLGLYSPDPDAFGPDDEAIAHILARHASVAVATARHEQTMARAVDARKLVGQAMGILMERYGLDDDRAFAILKRYSQDTNTKLRDVAQQLIDTRKLPRT
ncbi:GAF domain-containing protein [Kribbella sp. VKM Ac-2569]|uniref:GAF and ANTAR domain-containing protein n=1 Tax=Kribbella sp. VKM Ac-2569 TaxID=2512220 RepID=UPI00102C4AF0|nr:GAF and ANTAR domain-containing protein [Kribbella sp. VKM Ac-2569]RZT27634.1 GAF domain-containing protein [Kribbella sp. VKM Ac-2569]